MSYWIELHCDVQSNGPTFRGGVGPWCLSARNDNPARKIGNARTLLVAGVQHIETEARKAGWVQRNGRWACPPCRKHEGIP